MLFYELVGLLWKSDLEDSVVLRLVVVAAADRACIEMTFELCYAGP